MCVYQIPQLLRDQCVAPGELCAESVCITPPLHCWYAAWISTSATPDNCLVFWDVRLLFVEMLCFFAVEGGAGLEGTTPGDDGAIAVLCSAVCSAVIERIGSVCPTAAMAVAGAVRC